MDLAKHVWRVQGGQHDSGGDGGEHDYSGCDSGDDGEHDDQNGPNRADTSPI